MLGVLSAPTAILGEFQSLAGIGLAFGGHIVATLALLASEGEGRSFVRCHFLALFVRWFEV
jgi:hypothetical protein